MFYTYILYSKSTDTFYKGSTQNIQERLIRHNGKFEKATKLGAPWILLWYIQKTTKGEAQILEYKLKNLSRKRTCEFMMKYDEGIEGPDELLLLSNCRVADLSVSIRFPSVRKIMHSDFSFSIWIKKVT